MPVVTISAGYGAGGSRFTSGLIGMLALMPNLSGVVLPEVENPLFQRETERLIHGAADYGKVVVLGRAGPLTTSCSTHRRSAPTPASS